MLNVLKNAETGVLCLNVERTISPQTCALTPVGKALELALCFHSNMEAVQCLCLPKQCETY